MARRARAGALGLGVRGFTVDLCDARTFEDYIEAFKMGLRRKVGGEWHGRSWDAFHDYLSCPEEGHYRLTFDRWHPCRALTGDQRRITRIDLVEIAPRARPPVCRLVDLGKFCHEAAKRRRKKP